MVKKGGGRKCSYCGMNGHNARTCSSNGKNGGASLKLFGVDIIEKQEKPITKSASLGNLNSFNDKDDNAFDHHGHVDDGYLSDGYIGSRRFKAAHERKKGMPWTEEEHRVFLQGLKKLGKGDWRGISKNFVTTRTPTQVASHAQKYFLRQSSSDKKKRRSSLFDMTLKESVPASQPQDPSVFPATTLSEADNSSSLPLNKPREIQSNAIVQAQVLNRFPHIGLDYPIPMGHPSSVPSLFPSYPGIPHTAGFPGNRQSYLGVRTMAVPSFLHVVNYDDSRLAYPIPFKNPETVTACQPITTHPSGIPPPRNYLQQVPSGSSSSRKEDALVLTIGPTPQSPQGPPQASGPIRVI